MSHVKEGYKQTKVGVIPEDWTVCSINDLIENGLIYKPLDGNHGDIHPKSKDFIENGIPFIMANNLNGSQIDLQNCKFISKIQADKLQKGFSKEGDILLSHKGTVGEVAIVPNLATEYIMLTPQVTYYRVKDKNKIYNIYIKHYLSGFLFQNFINNIATGGTRAYISITEQRKLPFILPPIKEQQKIANILSTWDSAISKQEELITQKEKLKKGLMQKLLSGEVRFGGVDGEWEEVKLKKIAKKITEKNINNNYNDVLTNSAIHGVILQTDFFEKNIANNEKIDGYYIARVGDFIYNPRISKNSPTGPINQNTICDGVVSPLYTVFRIESKKVLSDYIKFYFRSSLWYRHMYSIANYGARHDRMSITDKDFFNMPIIIPFLKEQQKIAKVLTLADKEIQLLKNELEQLKTQKKGLMQKLLTGEVRVKL